MPAQPDEYLLRRLSESTASAAELETAAAMSQSAVARRLRDLIARGEVVRLGTTRGARYALRRTLTDAGSQWPLRRIRVNGGIEELGTLSALAPTQFYFAATSSSFAWSGISDGLPYYLQDQRPAGFLGRAVPQQYPELNLPQRVIDWNDDHYLRYLTQRGSDAVGDLILGDAALDAYLAQQHRRAVVRADDRETYYPRFVDDVMAGGLPGSSAHGEHPKFATVLEDAAGPRHVLVKFSPPIGTAVGQRWSDLLIAEHLAHEVLTQAGLKAARSIIFRFGDRTYLEVERFDRVALDGRIGVTSLFAIDANLYGRLDNWIAAASRLHADHRINGQSLETVRLVSTFGALIANTDRHFGNLAFYDRYDGRFEIAPVYDMLPMLFAPEHGQVPARVFVPAHPYSDTLHVFGRARALAENYWRVCAQDPRTSEEFRTLCSACESALQALPRTGAYASTT